MSERPWVLGISYSHNGAACLLHGDEIVAAVQEERLARYKRQLTFPRFTHASIDYCLQAARLRPDALDMIVYSVTRGVDANPQNDIFLNDYLRVGQSHVPLLTVPHHYAHAVSAFATSGFHESAILVIDGSGTTFERLPPEEQAVVINTGVSAPDWEWLSYYEAEGTTLRPMMKQTSPCHSFHDEIDKSASFGHMYGAVAQCLFGDYLEGAGKVMGLAPYGQPTIPVSQWIDIDAQGLVHFRPDGYRHARQCTWPDDFAGCADVAASVQRALEYGMQRLVCELRRRSSSAHLCYAGGVALNSVANEVIVRTGGFDDVFIFPAAEDSGVAVGAAYHGLWQLTGCHRPRRLTHDAFGRTYDEADVTKAVAAAPGVTICRTTQRTRDVVRLLCEGQIVGWFSGGSELGPRSLGQRSLLCDPRRPDAKAVVNARVKHREAFRPFAPVVLREHAEVWFDVPAHQADSPFMLRVWPFRPGFADRVPAVAHVDGTARVQTITRDTHPELYELVEAFAAETGVPILLNTSFNVAGEPIVETPSDALWCLLSTGVDCCVFGDQIVHKREGLQSVLDLRPRPVATTLTLDMPIMNGRVPSWHNGEGMQPLPDSFLLRPIHPVQLREMRALSQDRGTIKQPVVHVETRTAWGDVAVVLNEDHVSLLKALDGQIDGHALVEAKPGWTAAWLERTLVSMCRMSLIRFV
jgi:carbamoyltransferase